VTDDGDGDDATSDADDGSDDDAADAATSVSKTTHSAEKKPKFIFKNVRPNLEYAKIQRGEYSLVYMLGEAEAEADVNEGGSGTTPAPVSIAGGGRLMGKYQGQNVITKTGKYGAYIVWGSMNLSLKPLLGSGRGGKSEFDLSLQDIIAFIEKSTGAAGAGESASTDGAEGATDGTPYQGQILRTIDENTTIRYGRYGPYIFHKTAKMTKPAFVALKGFPEKHGNYMTCDVAKIHEWTAAAAEAGGGAHPKPKPKFGFFKKKK
jgi:hypothetical protein